MALTEARLTPPVEGANRHAETVGGRNHCAICKLRLFVRKKYYPCTHLLFFRLHTPIENVSRHRRVTAVDVTLFAGTKSLRRRISAA